jgi:hypothetical protein
MLALLTRHETIVALALVGGALSGLSWLLSSRGGSAAAAVRWCNGVAYAFMAASMALFIVAGFR